MTPNGALAVAFVLIALSMSGPGPRGTALLLMLTLAFALIELRGATFEHWVHRRPGAHELSSPHRDTSGRSL